MATAGILGKLYSNSMMVVFNSRMKIGPDNTRGTANDTSLSSVHRSRVETFVRPADAFEMHGGVAVTREQVSFPPSFSPSNKWGPVS